MLQPNLIRNELNYTAIALSTLTRYPIELRMMLQERGDWEDIVAWAMVGAVEGYMSHFDFRETYNATQRYTYQALIAAGFHRQSREKNGSAMQYQRHELRYHQIDSETRDAVRRKALLEALEK